MDRDLRPNRPGINQFASVYRRPRRDLQTIPDDVNISDIEDSEDSEDELHLDIFSSRDNTSESSSTNEEGLLVHEDGDRQGTEEVPSSRRNWRKRAKWREMAKEGATKSRC